jgi:hypothetical protein
MSASTDPLGRTCPHCGSTVTSEDYFCRACYRRFELRGAETDPTKLITLPEGSILSLRNPVLATLLSFLGIGLGQFYNGDWGKGLAFCAAWLGALVLPSVLAIPAVPQPWILGVMWGISLIDAPLSAWRINRLVKEFSGPSLFFFAELLIIAGLALWYFAGGDAMSWAGFISPAARFFL